MLSRRFLLVRLFQSLINKHVVHVCMSTAREERKKIIDQKTLLSRRRRQKNGNFSYFATFYHCWRKEILERPVSTASNAHRNQIQRRGRRSFNFTLKGKKNFSSRKENYHKLTTLYKKLLELSIEITFAMGKYENCLLLKRPMKITFKLNFFLVLSFHPDD